MAAAASAAAAEGETDHLGIPDQVLHVPKETSALRFFLMIVIVVVALIVFVAPAAFTNMLTGGSGPKDEVVMRWEHPSEGTLEVGQNEFYTTYQIFNEVVALDFLMRFQFGITTDQPTEEQAAGVFILDELGRQAGLHISNGDMAEYLRPLVEQRFGGSQEYYNYAARYGGTTKFEGVLRRILRARRYLQFTTHLASLPYPKAIEEAWADEHEDFAFDYVQVATTDMVEAAKAELPDAAALEAWFNELDEPARTRYMQEEKRRAEFVSFLDVESTPGAGLLEAYPAPEETDAEERAEDYYNRVFFMRFKRPQEPAEEPSDGEGEPADGEEGTEEPQEPPPSPFLSLEEVRDTCLAEAPIYFAMNEWLTDLQGRAAAGEEVDLAAEAEKLGLSHRNVEDPLGRFEFTELEGLEGPTVSTIVFQTALDSFSAATVVHDGGISITRVLETVAPAIPPFDQIQAEVSESWAEERASDLAIEKLEAMRDGFAELVVEYEEDELDEHGHPPGFHDEDGPADRRQASTDEFAGAAGTQGFEVQRRDWLDKNGLPQDDPNADDEAHVFFRRQRAWYDMEIGEVTEPVIDATSKYAYLARLEGKRPVPIERMTPNQYESQYKLRSAQAGLEVMRDTMLGEMLRTDYSLWLRVDEDPEGEVDAADGDDSDSQG